SNSKNKTIRMDYVFKSIEEATDLRLLLLSEAVKTLHLCVPEYKDLSIKEILDYEEYMESKLISGWRPEEVDIVTKGRRYQHLFSKLIFNRDSKCKICCLDQPYLLEAAHIKPYSKCSTDIERYDQHNGILLCRNHHKMFDKGYFTFDEKWNVIISKEVCREDEDLLIKTYEPCYIEGLRDFANCNKYINYHMANVFVK
ncbi:MAG: HNH endonuclease, partial [Mycoplasma sp.]